jgi:hypothetical protein
MPHSSQSSLLQVTSKQAKLMQKSAVLTNLRTGGSLNTGYVTSPSASFSNTATAADISGIPPYFNAANIGMRRYRGGQRPSRGALIGPKD